MVWGVLLIPFVYTTVRPTASSSVCRRRKRLTNERTDAALVCAVVNCCPMWARHAPGVKWCAILHETTCLSDVR